MDYKDAFLKNRITFFEIPYNIKTREFILSVADKVPLDQIPEYQDDDEIVLKIITSEGRNIKYVSIYD